MTEGPTYHGKMLQQKTHRTNHNNHKYVVVITNYNPAIAFQELPFSDPEINGSPTSNHIFTRPCSNLILTHPNLLYTYYICIYLEIERT